MKFLCRAAGVFFLYGAFQVGMIPAQAAEPRFQSDDPYVVLGVDPAIDNQALSRAWRALAIAHHTDTGGDPTIASSVNEAYQFLKAHRNDYDRRLFPFRGTFKKQETRPATLDFYEESNFQSHFQLYLSHEEQARQLVGRNYASKPVLMLYVILNLSGDRRDFDRFEPFQLRAYRELATHLDLFSLTRSELAGILMSDPVQALSLLLEHYDNFNIRLTTLSQLFKAYNAFYINTPGLAEELLSLIEHMTQNESLNDVRYRRIRAMAVKSLKNWLVRYMEQPRNIRRIYRIQYERTKRLVLKLEPFPTSTFTCLKLLIGIKPKTDVSF